MEISFKFTPVFKYKKRGLFNGIGKYIVDINGKLAIVEIDSDDSVQFVKWVETFDHLSDDEYVYFK